PARVAIALLIERDAHAGQSLQRERADLRTALADAGGEDHCVQSAHGSDVSAEVFPDTVAIGLERKQRAVLALVCGLEDFAHVARNARKAKQTAFLVQQFLALRGGEAFAAFEEGEHAGVHVPAAGPHNKALTASEPHGLLPRAPVASRPARR